MSAINFYIYITELFHLVVQEKTSLHFACEKDFVKVALILVKYNADVEIRDEVGS